MLKQIFVFLLFFSLFDLCFAQKSKINETLKLKVQKNEPLLSYDEKETTYKKGQILLIISPPGIFSFPTYRYTLDNPRKYFGTMPPSFMTMNLSSLAFISNRFALGLYYKFSQFQIKDTYLLNINTNNYEKTNLVGKIHNVLLYGRYYYLIRPKKGFDNEVMFYSGLGIGVGKVNWQADTNGKYYYYAIPNSEGIIYHIDILGVEKLLSKRFVFSMNCGYGSNGLVNMAIQYKIFSKEQ